MQIAKEKRNYILFVISVIFLAFISFYPAFNFGFIVDDWNQLWGAMFDSSLLTRYFSDHPSVAWEFVILSKFFGFNPFYYYIVSFVLKILCAFSIFLMIYGITKSKKASVYSGLIFASSTMGLEAFDRISAHYAAFSIILLSTGIFFWIRAAEKNFVVNSLISSILFLLAIFGDPGSAIMIIPILILWEIFNFYQMNFENEYIRIVLTKLLLIFGVLTISLGIVSYRVKYFSATLYSSQIQYALAHFFGSLNNYLNSIGHLLIGWFIPIDELIGISSPTILGLVAGYLILIFFFLQLVFFLKTKKDFYKITTLLLGWIIFFYFPSWVTQEHIVKGNLVIGVTNRYLALPAVGLICLLAIYLSKIKNKVFSLVCLIIILAVNLGTANRLLANEKQYRSQSVQETLYSKIDSDLPSNLNKNTILVFLGDNWLKILGLDWNGAFPLAQRRKIEKFNDFPIILGDMQGVMTKLCVDKYHLSNAYAWDISSGNLINVSEPFRQEIAQKTKCDLKN